MDEEEYKKALINLINIFLKENKCIKLQKRED